MQGCAVDDKRVRNLCWTTCEQHVRECCILFSAILAGHCIYIYHPRMFICGQIQNNIYPTVLLMVPTCSSLYRIHLLTIGVQGICTWVRFQSSLIGPNVRAVNVAYSQLTQLVQKFASAHR